jgi:hypothetical protein
MVQLLLLEEKVTAPVPLPPVALRFVVPPTVSVVAPALAVNVDCGIATRNDLAISGAAK